MSRYIDAEKLVKECLSSLTICPGFERQYIDAIYDRIRNAPAADVQEVRHGKWKKQGSEKTCSVCRFIYYGNSDDWNYCPNCGARMDGKENNNG